MAECCAILLYYPACCCTIEVLITGFVVYSSTRIPPSHRSPGSDAISSISRYISGPLYTTTQRISSPCRSPPVPQTWQPYKSPIKYFPHSSALTQTKPLQLTSVANRIPNRVYLSTTTLEAPNHPSAQEHREVIDRRIYAELSAGRLLGPILPQLLPGIHTSLMGLVPKSNQPGH